LDPVPAERIGLYGHHHRDHQGLESRALALRAF